MEVKSSGLLTVAVVAIVLVGGIAAFIALGNGGSDKGPTVDPNVPGDDPSDDDGRYDYSDDTALSWAYWLGNLDSSGVSDAETPITESDMVEVWRVTGQADSSSTNWRTPGSAVCVGGLTYYYNGSDSTINCVVTATGKKVASSSCPSAGVYNMAIAYGDGKIYVPTLSGSSTVLRTFDVETLEQLFVSEPVSGGEVQGAIVYRDGKVFFGTYSGAFYCFGTEDADTSSRDESVSPIWAVDGSGWYNMIPAFFGEHCVIVEKGYDIDGAVAYCVEVDTGAITDTMAFEWEYCVSGVTSYDGRVYIALNAVTDKANASSEVNMGKTLTIRSYVVENGEFVESSGKVWTSDVENGGTQSIPVVWNSRLHIGGGGSTMGSDEPFTVIDIDPDGNMTTAYVVEELQSKSTASMTTAYATEENGYAVYIYVIEYGHVLPGEASDSSRGSADIYVLRDTVGQDEADIVFTLTPSVQQFAFQSFTISPDGYLLIRNDSTLFCYGVGSESDAKDVIDAIDRILDMYEDGRINSADVKRVEERYLALSESERTGVTNYGDLQALYRTVTVVVGGESSEVRTPAGTAVDMPNIKVPEGMIISGWTCGGSSWDPASPVTLDITVTAVLEAPVTVSFDSAGGSDVGDIRVVSGDIIGYVAVPSRDGYVFDGWYSGTSEVVPQHSAATSDMTLTARWLKVSTITFDSAGGSSASSKEVVYSREIGELPAVTRTGYSFQGWYYGDTLYTSETEYPYQEGITLTARWSENAQTVLDHNGITIAGAFPDDSQLHVYEPYSGSGSVTAIKQAAGTDVDCYVVAVEGDGVDAGGTYVLSLPVGRAFDGSGMMIWCYLYGTGVTAVSGTVSDGILTVTVSGDTGGGGVQITFGIQAGTEMGRHI